MFALNVGYPKEILDKLPSSMYESFTGANNPQPFVELTALHRITPRAVDYSDFKIDYSDLP